HAIVIYSFVLYSPRAHRDLHSFPTRRSSDLTREITLGSVSTRERSTKGRRTKRYPGKSGTSRVTRRSFRCRTERQQGRKCSISRSEEHTSELQSLAYLVCRLLLEKKKNTEHN